MFLVYSIFKKKATAKARKKPSPHTNRKVAKATKGFGFFAIAVSRFLCYAEYMKKLLLYLDTSVISHLEQEDAPEKMADSRLFWEKVKAGEFDIALSFVTIRELGDCKEPKKTKLLEHLNEIQYQYIERTDEIESIARKFIENDILTTKNIDDCLHIASSIVYKCDAILSWNFKHIVNYKTVNGVKLVSLMAGYKEVAIYTPKMFVAFDEGDENDDL
jgi:predicted nucleic acid-binding protein